MIKNNSWYLWSFRFVQGLYILTSHKIYIGRFLSTNVRNNYKLLANIFMNIIIRDISIAFLSHNSEEHQGMWKLYLLPPKSAKSDDCAHIDRISLDYYAKDIYINTYLLLSENEKTNYITWYATSPERSRTWYSIGITIILESQLVDQKMSNRNSHWVTKSSKNDWSIVNVLMLMNPLE
jgi:hypothetical protein